MQWELALHRRARVNPDAIPEPIDFTERSEGKTRELCRQQYGGYYCMLAIGHQCPHEAIGIHGSEQWPLDPSIEHENHPNE